MSSNPVEEMRVLVFNVGSSSLTFKVYRHAEVLVAGKCHRLGVKSSEASYLESAYDGATTRLEVPLPDHLTALQHVLELLARNGVNFDAVGHRFADGGGHFDTGAVVDANTRPILERCAPLAPMHNVAALRMVDLIAERFPAARQYVVFDSTFHAGLPEVARAYALPTAMSLQYRKHGFHGLSYADVLEKATWYLGESHYKAVFLHLGTGGSSACAIVDGHSVDTSMGFSPLQGLVMNTRCGDIDPGVILDLVTRGYSADDLTRVLHRQSGLFGLSGEVSSDIRDLLKQKETNRNVELAIELYVYRIRQYVGAYAAIMNGLDVLVFTDDVGLRVPEIRSAVCKNMDFLGIALDEARNQDAQPDRIEAINADDSRVRVLSVPNDEERAIYAEGMILLAAG